MLITFSPKESFLYSINPVIKGLITLFLIIAFSVIASGPVELGILLATVVIFSLLGRVDLLPIIFSLRKIFFLLFIVGLIQGFSQGEFDFLLALEAILRIVGVFFSAGIFVTISSQTELMYFWEQTFRPLALFGLPARELALVMVIAVRFLPVILSEIDRIRIAQMARGAKLSGGFGLSAVKSLLPLMIPTLSLAIVRAGDLALAMEARGYCVSRSRTRFRHYRVEFIDLLGLLLCLGIIFALMKF
ncbi:MAG: energy-coupling factor transport system permease protein [Clostridiales bacterium]|nr:energy-coupling factor transport system permease protein [Clostridiales bacterium]MDN5280926.1 energy-coupling factor transport system permease protein [Candidatus Ozemobacter sp.]